LQIARAFFGYGAGRPQALASGQRQQAKKGKYAILHIHYVSPYWNI
jgi:hypothetical protein